METLLRELASLGIEVSTKGGNLVLKGDVPHDLLEQARAHKAEILAHLAGGTGGTGGGVGFGAGLRGGLGLGRTGSSGTSQTLLAKKTQPPKDTRLTLSIAILIFLFFLYSSSLSSNKLEYPR